MNITLNTFFLLTFTFITYLIANPVHAASPLPPGSYIETCSDCRMENHLLHCKCLQRNQFPHYTTLKHAHRCFTIENINGNLQCMKKRRWQLPAGSYLQSCNNCIYDGKDLQCECRMRHGIFWNTSLLKNANRCHGPISNIDGDLICQFYFRRGAIIMNKHAIS